MSSSKTRLRLTERDLELLGSIRRSLCLSSSQITALHFSSGKKASARCKKLSDGGLLRPSRHSWRFTAEKNELFYAVTALGCRALPSASRTSNGLAERSRMPREGSVSHLACINQCDLLLHQASTDSTAVTATFEPSWRLIRALHDHQGNRGMGEKGRARGHPVPDAAVCLQGSSDKALMFFLEVDCATEPIARRKTSGQSSIVAKVEEYCRVFDNASYHAMGEAVFHRLFSGFRLLLVTRGDTRCDAIMQAVTELGDTRFLWLTTFERMEREGFLGNCWRVADPSDPASYSIAARYVHPHAHREGIP